MSVSGFVAEVAVWPWRTETLRLIVVAVGLASCVTSNANAQQSCPAPLATATRLLVATTPTPDDMSGRIVLFERRAPGKRWRRAGPPQQMVVGMNGLAWGWNAGALMRTGERRKREGDKRTPAGVFRLTRPFGLAPNGNLPAYLHLRKGKTFCVDDVRSPHYGRIVTRAEAGRGTSGEDMATYRRLYSRGIVVDYPPNATERAGSCIFVHVWRSAVRGTAGCVAASERAVARMQQFAAGHDSAIVILPETARDRLRGCLPAEDG